MILSMILGIFIAIDVFFVREEHTEHISRYDLINDDQLN